MQEHREARKRLEVEQAGEAYMVELRRLYPERIKAERRLYDQYKTGATEVINLSSASDVDEGGARDEGHDRLIRRLTESKWERNENERDSE